MNFGKNTLKTGQSGNAPAGSAGNAMIYVLLALALIGLLTATIAKQDDNTSADLSADQVEFQVTQILGYAAAAQNTLDQMLLSGTNPDNIDFAMPSATSFNTAPYLNKFYHTQGGGLNYRALSPSTITQVSSSPAPGFYVGKVGNVEWSPSTAKEIVFAAYQISKPICENINKKITGSTTIPVTTAAMGDLFLEAPTWVSSNVDLNTSRCAGCVGHATLCISRSAADAFTFYSILLSR